MSALFLKKKHKEKTLTFRIEQNKHAASLAVFLAHIKVNTNVKNINILNVPVAVETTGENMMHERVRAHWGVILGYG